VKLFTKRIILAILFFSGVLLPLPLWARITIDPSFTGTLILTSPNGEVTLFEAGDPLPEITPKSTIEVFDGVFTMHTQTGDEVSVGCFGDGHSVGGGSTASLGCGENSGLLKVDGKEFPIAGVQAPAETAPPTAASNPTGVPTDQDTVPDSRNLQASPAN